jgi:hypothetical protein
MMQIYRINLNIGKKIKEIFKKNSIEGKGAKKRR